MDNKTISVVTSQESVVPTKTVLINVTSQMQAPTPGQIHCYLLSKDFEYKGVKEVVTTHKRHYYEYQKIGEPNFWYGNVIVPMDYESNDYADQLGFTLANLSEYKEHRLTGEIVADMLKF